MKNHLTVETLSNGLKVILKEIRTAPIIYSWLWYQVNALVIDVKDDTGFLTYPSKVPTAIAIGANKELRARDAEARVREMLAHGIYPIARIVVAKDPLLAERKAGWATQSRAGGLWRDRRGTAWVDAFNDSVWVYAAQLAAEAIEMGFAEVQFDYVRFPDEPRARMATAVYPARRAGESTRQGVQRNLTLLRSRMRPCGVPVTLDVFGMTTVMTGDMGIGQVWEDRDSVGPAMRTLRPRRCGEGCPTGTVSG